MGQQLILFYIHVHKIYCYGCENGCQRPLESDDLSVGWIDKKISLYIASTARKNLTGIVIMENLRKNINTVKFLLSAFWLFSLSFCVCVCACVCKLTFFPVEIRGRQVSPHDRLSLKHDRGSSCLSIGRPTSTGRPTYLIYLSCGSTCVTCSVRARARDRCSFFFLQRRDTAQV